MTLALARLASIAILLTTEGCGRAEPGDTMASTEHWTAAGSTEGAAIMTSIEIISGSHRWTATIDDSPAGSDFLAQLPLTLTLKDYAGSEKIADLPRPLARAGAPDAITPQAGDVAFYAPWGNLAIFYRDGHHSPGLIRLGRLQGDLTELKGEAALPVTLRRAERSN